MTTSSAIDVGGLRKRYDAFAALDDVTFTVAAGEIFGIIGRNGAGKTTLVECLATLRRPDDGRVRVLGLDPSIDSAALRPRIGVQLQTATLPERLRLREALELFAAFYPKRRPWRDLLERLGLADSAEVPFGALSGGQRQRAFIALALVHEPEVVFLDELTTGLDPHARHEIWALVRAIRDRGVTVLLTTHFMEEAERLCDRVAVMRRGRFVALDAPERLVAAVGARRRLSFRVATPLDVATQLDLAPLRALASVEDIQWVDGRVVVEGRDDAMAGDVIAVLTGAGARALDVRTEQSTLEDAFFALTGQRLDES